MKYSVRSTIVLRGLAARGRAAARLMAVDQVLAVVGERAGVTRRDAGIDCDHSSVGFSTPALGVATGRRQVELVHGEAVAARAHGVAGGACRRRSAARCCRGRSCPARPCETRRRNLASVGSEILILKMSMPLQLPLRSRRCRCRARRGPCPARRSRCASRSRLGAPASLPVAAMRSCSDHHRVRRIGDVEDVDALEARADELAGAGRARAGRGGPRSGSRRLP